MIQFICTYLTQAAKTSGGAGKPLPVVGDIWLLSTTEFEPDSRIEDEEYYAEVLRWASKEEEVEAGADGTTQFVVQDLGEEADEEVVSSVKRHIFNATPLILL